MIKCDINDIYCLLFGYHSLFAEHAHTIGILYKDGNLFLFYYNCAKPDAPIKAVNHVFNIGTYRPV